MLPCDKHYERVPRFSNPEEESPSVKQSDECRALLADPDGYVKKLKAKSGCKVVGTLCSYAPEEIILAAGAHPYRLFGSGEEIRRAEAHLQSYCCSLVRGTLEDALAGRLAFLDGAVFPHTCDSIQRLSDIWRMNIPCGFHLDLVLPVKLAGDGARRYLVDVLARFRRELGEALGVTITDAALGEAIRLTNRIRRAWARTDALRSERPGLLSGGDFDALARAALVLDRRRVAALCEEVAGELEGRAKASGTGGGKDSGNGEGSGKGASAAACKRIVLAGGVCTQPDIHRFLEEAGGVVVGDDLCTGSRAFRGLIEEGAEPLAAIADRLLARISCPAKHRGLTDRADHLLALVRGRRAQGVILFLLKLCDPQAFDVPTLREALERAGIPSLVLEVEDRLPAEGQLRTRLETFVEMI
jgi:benzoyl-CoA reductase/2-hydroxyglutaryl-CoA dehydratase subunit BcrC/BadD/HgdB